MADKILQAVQIGLGRKFGTDREAKLSFMSQVFGREVASSKQLKKEEALALAEFFRTGKMTPDRSFALFDKKKRQHMAILSRFHTLGWVLDENPRHVDLDRLGSFIKSKFHKPLLQMDACELNKVINAADSMAKKEFIK